MKKENTLVLLEREIEKITHCLDKSVKKDVDPFYIKEVGIVTSVGKGVLQARGLPNVKSGEIVSFKDNSLGMVFNLNPDSVDIILLDSTGKFSSGDEVRRTNNVMDVPVGEALLGRLVDPAGRPLDEKGKINYVDRMPVERNAPPIMHRDPVNVPLQTGLLSIDALIPIGRGQRELILGDRQTGKTAIAIDTVLNQKKGDIICIYCAIGQKLSSVSQVVNKLKEKGAMDHSVVVIASGEDTPGLNYIAPYSATSIGEYFMNIGKDVLIIYDDLTHHARSYR